MKKTLCMLLALILCVSCGIKTKTLYEESESSDVEIVEDSHLQLDSIERSLVLKMYDEFNERTKVSYSGNAKNGNIYIAASYNINKNDIVKNRLPEPQADDFTICVVASHRGAKDVSRVELSTNGGLYTLRPNFKKHEGKGKFTMIFNIARSLNNHFYPERISEAERVDARVVFDNGSETCELTKEDLKSISVVYKSFLMDGGKFE